MAQDGELDAILAWRAGGRLLIGRERIALLESVIIHKSITKAAEATGYSCKTAWDAVNAINNLLPRPGFITRTGGGGGGGVEVTEEGLRLIRTFRRLEARLRAISTSIVQSGLEHEDDLFFFGGIKLSVRNALFCEVTKIAPARVNSEVKLQAPPEIVITSLVSNSTLEELRLAPGRHCIAMVNAQSVMLAPEGEVLRISARNKIAGTVISRIDDETGSEVIVEIGGKTLTSVISREGAEVAGANIGERVVAIFKTSHVVLACD